MDATKVRMYILQTSITGLQLQKLKEAMRMLGIKSIRISEVAHNGRVMMHVATGPSCRLKVVH